jgi:hypothetical protein
MRFSRTEFVGPEKNQVKFYRILGIILLRELDCFLGFRHRPNVMVLFSFTPHACLGDIKNVSQLQIPK